MEENNEYANLVTELAVSNSYRILTLMDRLMVDYPDLTSGLTSEDIRAISISGLIEAYRQANKLNL